MPTFGRPCCGPNRRAQIQGGLEAASVYTSQSNLRDSGQRIMGEKELIVWPHQTRMGLSPSDRVAL